MESGHKILCLYSGGLDSTGMLWKLIQTPKYHGYTLLVHHVHIVNHTKRFKSEQQAVERLIPLLNKYSSNKIYFSSSIIDLAFMGNQIPIDANLYGFVAANLANIDLGIKYIAVGRTLDDKNSGGDEFVQIVNCIENAQKQVNYLKENPSQATCITPIIDLTKQQIWQMLPQEIKDLTWSCRTPKQVSKNPIAYEACGKCHACLAIKELS